MISQDELPQEKGLPHCFLPLHLWLDKSKVTETVKMHLIILCAGFLPSTIRNGLGNGGGILIGYMPIMSFALQWLIRHTNSYLYQVGNLNENSELEDDSVASVEVAQFKQDIYYKVLDIIFASLKKPSHFSEAVKCGDSILRVLFPGFLINTIDCEEAYMACGTHGTKANHPCPQCLISKNELSYLSKSFRPHTSSSMIKLCSQALNATSVTAHDSMDKIPQWHGLKHFKYVISADFTDGNSYHDILKVCSF